MDIQPKELQAQDIEEICTNARDSIKKTEIVMSSTSKQEIQQHRSVLSEADSGVEQLMNYLTGEINRLKSSLSAVKAMKNDIRRKDDILKNAYFLLRDKEKTL